jgi:O-acetyl-ADP-ribose deacetylase (regulator of RNase III)
MRAVIVWHECTISLGIHFVNIFIPHHLYRVPTFLCDQNKSQMKEIKLILVDVNPHMCAAWEAAFAGHKNVDVVNDYFQRLPVYDCMVSAANSYGQMDGGIDGHITDYFGQQLMDRVQAHIVEHYLGEQPIGSSFILPTFHEKHPFLAHTPTMRIPESIAHTDNVYHGMRAMLLAVHHHNLTSDQKINSIACPGLGALTGQVPFEKAARQMERAYASVIEPLTVLSWERIIRNRKSL